ncbi:hypothetical protein EST38_g3118 [Candolleomyces aberdarensis]|uniref:DUF7330 domain-containing protein n=1 Tax=Candolleomyces aberdarensis TaxID=2316362 RepID=A0A4V1Q4P0_9AGAR|nr:hypothetical protein EST38_g3118 [Candolleomyces aberdarensis]
MIIDSSTNSKSDPLGEFRPKNGDTEDTDSPPPYTPLPGGADGVQAPDMPRAVPTRRPTLPTPKASKFVSLAKPNGAIKGTWSIDPSLIVPAPFLPPLQRGETDQSRKNLYLKTNNGAITADVTLVTGLSRSTSDARSAVSFEALTFNGSVKFSLRETSPGQARLPMKINIESLNGAIHVSVPRSFRGIVVGTTFNGNTKPSEEIASQIQFDTEDGRTRRFFIGDFSAEDFSSGSNWAGDEVNANTKSGSIKIRFVDEIDPTPSTSDAGIYYPKSTGGFFSRIWDALF